MQPEPVPIVPLRILPARPSRRVFHRPDTVATDVCGRFGVTFEAVAGRMAGGQLRAARRELCRALRARTAMSLSEIGQFLGGRDHTTILHLLQERR